MRYELQNDYVVLTGNAYLEQLDSNIKGDKITYLVKEQKWVRLQRKIKVDASPPFWCRPSCKTKAATSKRRVTNPLWQP